MAEPPFGAVLAGGESSRYGSPKPLARVAGRRIVDRVVAALRTVVPDVIVSANDPSLFRDLGLPIHPDERPGLGPLAGIYTTLLRARDAGRPGILAVAGDMPFPSSELLALLAYTAFGDAHGPASGRNGDSYGYSYWYSHWYSVAASVAASGLDPDLDASPDSGLSPDRNDGPDTDPHRDTDPSTRTDTDTDPGPPDIALPASPGPRGVEPLFAAYRTTCLPAIEAALAAGDRRMIGFHERVRVRTIPVEVVESLCDPSVAFLNVNTPGDRERAEAVAARAEKAGGPTPGPGSHRRADGAVESSEGEG
ncbi:MAG: molybdenum cofactor guanylyltransferase [Longimicrobiales bacterium]|nr:molybdenum cofactor guanylyltransferase [Longimicrobiales bacterium]